MAIGISRPKSDQLSNTKINSTQRERARKHCQKSHRITQYVSPGLEVGKWIESVYAPEGVAKGMIRQGKVKLVILTNSCRTFRKSETEYYAMLAKTGVHHYSGNNIEWGTGCGKKLQSNPGVAPDPVGCGVILRFCPQSKQKKAKTKRHREGNTEEAVNQFQSHLTVVIKPIFCDCFLVCVLKFLPFSLTSLVKILFNHTELFQYLLPLGSHCHSQQSLDQKSPGKLTSKSRPSLPSTYHFRTSLNNMAQLTSHTHWSKDEKKVLRVAASFAVQRMVTALCLQVLTTDPFFTEADYCKWLLKKQASSRSLQTTNWNLGITYLSRIEKFTLEKLITIQVKQCSNCHQTIKLAGDLEAELLHIKQEEKQSCSTPAVLVNTDKYTNVHNENYKALICSSPPASDHSTFQGPPKRLIFQINVYTH
eukprot:bmy_17874T0